MKKLRLLSSILVLLLFATTGYIHAQTVSGIVTSAEDGQTLPGITVLLQGTNTGVATNLEGEYEINLNSDQFENGTLVFSGVGFIQQAVPINGRSEINIELATDTQLLDEVVVVGFGSQIKEKVTGNISSVSASDIEGVPVNSLEQAVQGKAAGVFIQTNNGKLGQGIQVRVRGSASVSASNQPLYVIDGIPVTTANLSINAAATNPLADINPNDIESIDILKDASAAAIYGSRGSNGVVLITTKSGQSGATQFDANYSISTSQPSGKKDWLNADQYLELFNEAFANSSTDGTINGTLFGFTRDELFDTFIPGWDQGYDTDWQELAFQDNTSHKFDLSASGGDDKTRFRVSGQYSGQEGIIIDNTFDRISGRLNLDHTANDKVQIGTNLNVVKSVNNRLSTDNAFSTPIQLVALPPVQRPFNDEGEPSRETVYDNGLLFRDGASFETTVFRALGNAFINYEPIDNLILRGEFGADVLDQNEERWYGSSVSQFTGATRGTADNRYVRVVNITSQAYANYIKDLTEEQSIDITAGLSTQQVETDQVYVSGIDFPNDLFRQVASAATIDAGDATNTSYSFTSYFARANYSFDDTYLLNISGTVDGSSRFGENNRYGFFPAASAGWILSNEDFLEDVDQISFLKFRASYGFTGNAEIGNFPSRGLFGAGAYGGASGLAPTQSPNPDLKWETTKQFNVGVDLGLFSDRVTAEIDYYSKNTEDLLLSVNVPATTGFTTQTRNVGSLENNGFEFVVTTRNFVGDFSWSTTFNFGANENKITNLDGQVIEGSFVSQAVEGEPIGVFFAREYAGVDPDNGDALYYVHSPDGKDYSAGTTNSFNAANRVVIGDPNPDFQGGIGNTFNYKGFDLNIFFQYVYGNDIYNGGGTFQSANADFFDNQTVDQMDRWQQPGDITDVPQARLLGGNGTGESSRYLSDGSYLRLKTLTLGYTLPQSLMDRLSLRKARLYFTGLNLLTFTDYDGWDPEVNTDFTASNITLGTDFYAAPQPRTFEVGINLGF
ncbi:TonB-dependent receptor [Gracilimonas sp.]